MPKGVKRCQKVSKDVKRCQKMSKAMRLAKGLSFGDSESMKFEVGIRYPNCGQGAFGSVSKWRLHASTQSVAVKQSLGKWGAKGVLNPRADVLLLRVLYGILPRGLGDMKDLRMSISVEPD